MAEHDAFRITGAARGVLNERDAIRTSVPGAIYAGLIIGLIPAVSAYWFGPIYKDIVVYGLFVALLWLRPQGLMGKA